MNKIFLSVLLLTSISFASDLERFPWNQKEVKQKKILFKIKQEEIKMNYEYKIANILSELSILEKDLIGFEERYLILDFKQYFQDRYLEEIAEVFKLHNNINQILKSKEEIKDAVINSSMIHSNLVFNAKYSNQSKKHKKIKKHSEDYNKVVSSFTLEEQWEDFKEKKEIKKQPIKDIYKPEKVDMLHNDTDIKNINYLVKNKDKIQRILMKIKDVEKKLNGFEDERIVFEKFYNYFETKYVVKVKDIVKIKENIDFIIANMDNGSI